MPRAEHRLIEPEWLDHAGPGETRGSLRDLTRINRYLGGYGVLRRMLARLVKPDQSFTFLDVGAASGDMGVVVRKAYSRARVTSLDLKWDHLAAAPRDRLAGDAFRLPFCNESFDLVFSSLFLHHFEDEAVADLLKEFARVARRAVLAIDLERGRLGYHFVPATAWLFRWDPMTIHDAPTSVNAAFKREELVALAHRAGLRTATVQIQRPWSRLALIAEK